jgi:hypothetical protein
MTAFPGSNPVEMLTGTGMVALPPIGVCQKSVNLCVFRIVHQDLPEGIPCCGMIPLESQLPGISESRIRITDGLLGYCEVEKTTYHYKYPKHPPHG